jgi:riboflavin kinase / FMN adenylyltransferase
MSFRALTDPEVLPADLQRPILAIGNFDGMHRGHRAVFAAARDLAAGLSAPVAALTFEPHPRSYFRPAQPVFRLTPPAMKARLAERFGLDGLIALTFDAGLAGMTASAFVEDTLARRFGVRGVVIGEDFSFGRGREGDAAFLAESSRKLDFHLRTVAPSLSAGAAISSSTIRAALERGELGKANDLLGYSYAILGEVVHGRKLGRTIGYPTANIALEPDSRLCMGIYAVRLKRGNMLLPGVASFGKRPTFDNGPPLLEVFLFDFSGDLYGETVEVFFEAYLRPEMKFDGVEPLLHQMDKDSAEARRILSA